MKSGSSRRSRQQRPARRRTSGRMIALVAAAVFLIVGGVLILAWPRGGSSPTVAGATGEKGSADAKVTIVEYSDFQCPFCAYFTRDTEPKIDRDYIATGKVRFVYKNMIVIGPESQWAGEASYCAGDQGKYWEYHDKLFASQAGENRGAFSKANLKRFAAELGLAAADFDSCLDGGKYAQKVRNETSEGQSRGVKSTPSFFVNNVPIQGAQRYEEFQRVIEAELRRAQ